MKKITGKIIKKQCVICEKIKDIKPNYKYLGETCHSCYGIMFELIPRKINKNNKNNPDLWFKTKTGYYIKTINQRIVYKHRKLYEDYYKISLTKEQYVHHIDGNKENNDISNLELTTIKEHARHHAIERHLQVKKW